MNKNEKRELQLAAEKGEAVSEEIALAVLHSAINDIPGIMACANAVRIRHFGRRVTLCSIVNAKSGACKEDCAFCAQSVQNQTDANAYGLYPEEKIVEAYDKAAKLPINHFGIVTSGKALSSKNVERICKAIKTREKNDLNWCASLGSLNKDQLLKLKEAGFKRFHHNLETAESFFPRICSTHTFTEKLETIRRVKAVGLEICCGGVIGLGETLKQRVELASILKREGVDSIPLNFLIPIPGTRLENFKPMEPMDIIRCVAMFRLMNPKAELKVCAGRSLLRDLQSMIFFAGATGMMIGPLLTVAGRDVNADLKMLKDLEIDSGLNLSDS